MHKIKYYEYKFSKTNDKQGSQAWLNSRQYSFGGSEMATVLDQNKKYETFEALIENKKSKSYKENDCTLWGQLFEPVAKIYIEKEYGTIYELGAIPHPLYPICYSPDGLLIDKENKDDLILLEIKNPIFRGIKNIPPHYLCQVHTGLNIFHTKYCLFAQFRFRRCKIKEIPWSCVYDRKYHKEYRNRCKDSHPIAFGYIYWPADNKLIDLANFDDMTSEINKIPSHIKHEILIDKQPTFEKGYVLMWKLFEHNYQQIKPDYDYFKGYEDLLWQKYKILLTEIQNHNKIKSDYIDINDIEDFDIIDKNIII